MNKTGSILSKIRNAFGALFIIAVVVVVPLFSFVELGHFFLGGPKRNVEALAPLQTRQADDQASAAQLFDEPLITVTYDDGYETTYSVAMPLLQKYGIRTTQYVLSGTADNPTYVSWKQIEHMQRAGHEIACHTIDHSNLTSLQDEDLHRQLQTCKSELTKRFGPIYNFAAPYGAQNAKTQNAITQYFGSQRNTVGDPKNGVDSTDVNVAQGFNRNDIIGVTVRSDTTMEDLQKLVAYTKKHNGWLVLTYHQANDHSSVYSLDTDAMDRQLRYLSSTDVRIVTMQDALSSVEIKTGRF